MGRTFAALRNYQVDGNKEMMAIGFMNMAGSCSSCYVTTGEDPLLIRTFLNQQFFTKITQTNLLHLFFQDRFPDLL